MEAVAITVQVLSGRKVQIMAEPCELVSVVRQRVEEQEGISGFQEVKLLMGVEELCYDVSVGESGMLDSPVQAVITTNVSKAREVIRTQQLQAPPPTLSPLNPPLLQPFSFLKHPRPRGPKLTDAQRKFLLAVDVLAEIDSDDEDTAELLRECEAWCRSRSLPLFMHLVSRFGSMNNFSPGVVRFLSEYLRWQVCNIADEDSDVWVKLIGTLAPYDGDHSPSILCALASYHAVPVVRAAAVRAFGLAPVWAANYIQGLRRIAYASDADPDESVRDAAAASLQALEAQVATPQAE